MNKATYDQHVETLASGKIVIVGGRTASSVEELDALRQSLLAKSAADPAKAGADTTRQGDELEAVEAEQKAGEAAAAKAETLAQSTAAKMAASAEDNLSPKAVHDNKTAEDLIAEGSIPPQAGSEGPSAEQLAATLSVPPNTDGAPKAAVNARGASRTRTE